MQLRPISFCNNHDVGLDEQLIKVMLYRIAIAGPSTPLDILDGHEFPDKSRLVFLREEPNCSTSRSIFISMGTAEADPIADLMSGKRSTRPLTHDLLCGIIGALNAKVISAVVNQFNNGVFNAQIRFKQNGEEIIVDCRPSDAMAVALRTKAPIYVDKKVLDGVGIQLDK